MKIKARYHGWCARARSRQSWEIKMTKQQTDNAEWSAIARAKAGGG